MTGIPDLQAAGGYQLPAEHASCPQFRAGHQALLLSSAAYHHELLMKATRLFKRAATAVDSPESLTDMLARLEALQLVYQHAQSHHEASDDDDHADLVDIVDGQ